MLAGRHGTTVGLGLVTDGVSIVDWSRDGDTLRIHSRSEADTEALGRALAAIIRPGVVIGMVGTLGAGKTRLARAIAEALGADPGAIASPTFVLVHEYDAEIPIYHFDAYRLASPEQFEALGTDEYFAGEGLCLVEWADLVERCLPSDAWWIHLEVEGLERSIQLRLPLEVTKALETHLGA